MAWHASIKVMIQHLKPKHDGVIDEDDGRKQETMTGFTM